MNTKPSSRLLFRLGICCGLLAGLRAQAQPITPGIDCWTTPRGGSTYLSFASNPLPTNFFGPGCESFNGSITLMGTPLQTTPPAVLGQIGRASCRERV